ncbi:hypothetical protein HPB48_023787 [Haemaphysalis longicornis]|uniref:Uncharacterized protein n=1 Tax=Haemaphysalis longicornis TaxID=44386 RepID=A0A9J6H7G0_HAELO|nr:hypothetical protein HPB48_023787 [Haemaphysalis longicornis]
MASLRREVADKTRNTPTSDTVTGAEVELPEVVLLAEAVLAAGRALEDARLEADSQVHDRLLQLTAHGNRRTFNEKGNEISLMYRIVYIVSQRSRASGRAEYFHIRIYLCDMHCFDIFSGPQVF